ncbi:MAG: hypothetical protein IPN82_15660 [Chitinophagaceae bacterium]|nr:hypothetical protein [Chitinophagaceae bacterium]
MSILGCKDVDFSKNSNGAGSYNGTAAWNNPDNVNDSVVNQLETYGWVLANRVLKKREAELEKDGWRKVYTEYNLAGGPDANRWVGKRISASPDSMYKAISTVMNSSFKLKAINADKVDADGNPNFVFEADFPGDSLAETNTYIPNEHLKKLIFAAVSNDQVNTNNAGIIVYRKKYSFRDDFQAVLDDAKNGFTSFIVSETKDPDGVTVFSTKTTFGIKTQMVYKAKSDNQWVYRMTIKPGAPEAERIKKSAVEIINEYVKAGNYETESGELQGSMIYRLLDKNGEMLFSDCYRKQSAGIVIFLWGKINSLIKFFLYKIFNKSFKGIEMKKLFLSALLITFGLISFSQAPAG